jgi:hypothetical protein
MSTPQKFTSVAPVHLNIGNTPISSPTTPATPASSLKQCPICHKELSWLSRKRTCTLCHGTSCRECASKKVIDGQIVCQVCQKARGLKKKTDDPSSVVEEPDSPILSQSDLSRKRKQLIPQQCYANLHIKIVEARGLIAADTNILGKPTTSDPYCVVTLTREKTRRVTNYVNSTLSPVWNEEFDIPIRFPNQNLVIKVFDRDVTSKDDEMGFIEIPISSLPNGREINGWAPLLYYEKVDPNKLVEVVPGTDFSSGSSRIPVPAGSVRVSITLDFKIHQELFAYIRSAVAIPPTKKSQFNVNALYGPGMLVVDLLWWRLGQPILGIIMYVLYWENFLVSLFSLILWIPIAMNMEYWPSGFFFLMDAIMVRNLMRRKYQALADAEDPTITDDSPEVAPSTPTRKSASRKSIMTESQMNKLKVLSSATKNLNHVEETVTPKKPEKKSDAVPEEMSLGSFVGTMSMMAPGWVKEYAAYYQPLLRMVADYLILLLGVMEMSSPLSIPLLVIFAGLGISLLYVQFKLFVMVVGGFVLFFFSPFMSIFYGVVYYITRPWPNKTPEQFGMSVEFDKDFMSVAANAHELRKTKSKIAKSS